MTTTDDRSLERLAGLLAMAEGSDNEAERDAFMVRAQELSTLYSISLATARAHDTKKRNATTPLTRVVSIGERGKHGLKNYVELICEIARANNTKLTIAHNSTFVTLYGFVEDIDLTITLYGSLLGRWSRRRNAGWRPVPTKPRWTYARSPDETPSAARIKTLTMRRCPNRPPAPSSK